ncbi:MAG: hypothetical protein O3B13_07795 [Planctomycetota bacterium]|nr:hypothetical protein [Planctomycetota bacterium]MDA1162988.1 hypothetical protein [Planctomycetota bacterium]
MVECKTILSWVLAISLGGASAVLSDETDNYVVHPETETPDVRDTTELKIDRIFDQPVVTPVVAEALFETDCCPNPPPGERTGGCSETASCSTDGGCLSIGDCNPDAWFRFDADAKSVLPEGNPIDELMKTVLAPKDWFNCPVNVGGWHWWNIDTGGVGNGGYGAVGFRGTYAYYVVAQPEVKLDDDSKIGAYVFYAGRDGEPYRSYYPSNFWFLEAYASYSSDDLGILKAGLINTKFGLDYYLGFIGTAPYFDGFIQDADYGLSWEKKHEVCDDLTVDTVAQFFFHDGAWNGGLANHNTESVAGLHERNTLVLRMAPKWTLSDDSTLAWGISGLVGEIDSNVPGFANDTRTVLGTDVDYFNGPLNLRGEVLQVNGRTVPTRLVSGGPSSRITSFSAEAGYTVGPVKYRGVYSASYDAHPAGRQNIWSLGAVTQVTPNVRLFTEYTEWTVDGNSAFGSTSIIEGVQMVVHWHY